MQGIPVFARKRALRFFESLRDDPVDGPEATALADLFREPQRKAARLRSREPRATGKTAEQRRGEREDAYMLARRDAFDRSVCASDGATRCEHVGIVNGQEVRCPQYGADPDHILGGAMRKECERLGAEGLMVLCRQHHDTKHANSPTRGYWLDQAQAHALRIGAKRLLPLIYKAREKYAAKHGAAIRLEVDPEHRQEDTTR